MTASPLAAAPGAAVPEKRSVALSSLLAAALLTGLKIAVGIATGSLGILSEAAHSGLDLVAAVITYVS
ncbi:MAG TPA: cation transporter, partial [bacterium]|nr:cation transporter [bacterium]